ncbi:MAG: ROK family protein [Candidatus Dormibacteraeota bacterium]|nr:ROK family protein [Candidatus Dormibacteraeota bacterium]
MNGVLVGVDLGGTNIRAAIATGPVTHAAPVHAATPAAEGPDAVLDAVASAANEAAAAAGKRIAGLAIGIPGPLDPSTGVVHAAPHLAGWNETPAGDLLGSRLGCPVAVRNDATLAGYAEWVSGAGKGTRHFVFMTVSTGVGGALVLDGEPYDGIGSAGEVGHAPVDPDGPPCGQGHPGCLEGTASGTAIARAARAALASGTRSTLSSADPSTLDARAVEDAAKRGDELSIRLFAEAGRAIGRACGGLVNTLAPETIAIGGGLINAGDLLFKPLLAAVPEIAFAWPLSRCRILPAALGTDAGLVGAVAWAVHTFGDVAD